MSYIQSSAFKRDALGYAGNEIGHAWLGFNCVMLTFGVFSDHVYEAPNVGIIAMFTFTSVPIIRYGGTKTKHLRAGSCRGYRYSA